MRKLNFRLGRAADTTRSLAQDLQDLEKKQECDRYTYSVAYEKLKDSLLTSGRSDEKRIKKLKEYELGASISELALTANQVNAQLTASTTPQRGQSVRESQPTTARRDNRSLEDVITVLHRFGDVQVQLAKQRVNFELNVVETNILPKLQRIVEEEVPALQKQKKTLSKMESEFESLRTRLTTADDKLSRERTDQSANTSVTASFGSIDALANGQPTGTLKAEQLASLVSKLRDEADEASAKLDATREAYALDLYAFDARTSERVGLFVAHLEAQLAYYRACATCIDGALAPLRATVDALRRVPVYGTSLHEHLHAARREIAYPLQFCAETLVALDALEEEGLFRVAGGHTRLRNLKRSFDVGRLIDPADYAADVHALTGAIKQYLRELAEPLLTYALYDEWIAAATHGGADSGPSLTALKACVDKLPAENHRNLEYLVEFLQLVARRSDINRMSPNNLAICVGPNLLWTATPATACSEPGFDSAAANANSNVHLCSAIAETLITNHDFFFPNGVFLKQFEGQLERLRLAAKTNANNSQPDGDQQQASQTTAVAASVPSVNCSPNKNLMTESFYAPDGMLPGRNVRAKSAHRGSNTHDVHHDKKKNKARMFNMHMPQALRSSPNAAVVVANDDAKNRKVPTSPLVLLAERSGPLTNQNTPARDAVADSPTPVHINVRHEDDDRSVSVASVDALSVPPSPSPSPSLSSDASYTRPPAEQPSTASVSTLASRSNSRNTYASDNEAETENRWALDRERPHTQSSVSVTSAARRMRDWSMQPASSIDRDEAYWRERRNGTLSTRSASSSTQPDKPSTSQSFSTRTLPRSGVVLKTLAEAEAALGIRGNALSLADNTTASKLPISSSLSGGNLARRFTATNAMISSVADQATSRFEERANTQTSGHSPRSTISRLPPPTFTTAKSDGVSGSLGISANSCSYLPSNSTSQPTTSATSTPSSTPTPTADQRAAPHFTIVTDIPLAHSGAPKAVDSVGTNANMRSFLVGSIGPAPNTVAKTNPQMPTATATPTSTLTSTVAAAADSSEPSARGRSQTGPSAASKAPLDTRSARGSMQSRINLPNSTSVTQSQQGDTQTQMLLDRAASQQVEDGVKRRSSSQTSSPSTSYTLPKATRNSLEQSAAARAAETNEASASTSSAPQNASLRRPAVPAEEATYL